MHTVKYETFHAQFHKYTLYFIYLGIGEYVSTYICTTGNLYTGERIAGKIRENILKLAWDKILDTPTKLVMEKSRLGLQQTQTQFKTAFPKRSGLLWALSRRSLPHSSSDFSNLGNLPSYCPPPLSQLSWLWVEAQDSSWSLREYLSSLTREVVQSLKRSWARFEMRRPSVQKINWLTSTVAFWIFPNDSEGRVNTWWLVCSLSWCQSSTSIMGLLFGCF